MDHINIFISHSWKYPEHYKAVIAALNAYKVRFNDHSASKERPVLNARTNKQLRDALNRKIYGASCVVFFSGVYSSYSDWIEEELIIAKQYGKPIVCIRPWAQRKKSRLESYADEVVGWNAPTFVRAITTHALKR